MGRGADGSLRRFAPRNDDSSMVENRSSCEATVAVLHGAQFELAKDQRLNQPRKSRGLALG
jgi:hypothetical protein